MAAPGKMADKLHYRLKILGTLEPYWREYLGGVDIRVEGKTTIIEGFFVDQPALHSLLTKLGDHGLKLIEVEQIVDQRDEP